MRLKLSQPNLAGVGAGAELGKNPERIEIFDVSKRGYAFLFQRSW